MLTAKDIDRRVGLWGVEDKNVMLRMNFYLNMSLQGKDRTTLEHMGCTSIMRSPGRVSTIALALIGVRYSTLT